MLKVKIKATDAEARKLLEEGIPKKKFQYVPKSKRDKKEDSET